VIPLGLKIIYTLFACALVPIYWRQYGPTNFLWFSDIALLALVPMLAIMPKPTAEGITLASPIFDHSKIAMIDEMIRTGVPARNPFFGEAGAPERVSYYYLWHFSAAAAAVMTGVSGWEADAGLTAFTAFASLLLMMGLAPQRLEEMGIVVPRPQRVVPAASAPQRDLDRHCVRRHRPRRE
jgi:hypothetical protein